MTELRPIERLDQAKIEKLVSTLAPLFAGLDDNKWAIGDSLAAELPKQSRAETLLAMKAAKDGGEPELWRYLEAVAAKLGRSPHTLRNYREAALEWAPEERHASASWSNHHAVRGRADRHELVEMSHSALRRHITMNPSARASTKRGRRDLSFANISKAAEAAIEVLADDDIPADKRVAIALNILVKFFEEAAAA